MGTTIAMFNALLSIMRMLKTLIQALMSCKNTKSLIFDAVNEILKYFRTEKPNVVLEII